MVDNNTVNSLKTWTNKKFLQVADAVIPGTSAVVGIARGVVFTPKMELMFEGINRRSFSYSFIMNPTSKNEADQIRQIIQTFKVHSAADYNDNLGMEMTIPDTWKIEYYNNNGGSPGINNYLTKISECFLETITATYGGDKYTTHEPNGEGAPPTRVTLSLNFRELEIQTKSILQGNPAGGNVGGASTLENPFNIPT